MCSSFPDLTLPDNSYETLRPHEYATITNGNREAMPEELYNPGYTGAVTQTDPIIFMNDHHEYAEVGQSKTRLKIKVPLANNSPPLNQNAEEKQGQVPSPYLIPAKQSSSQSAKKLSKNNVEEKYAYSNVSLDKEQPPSTYLVPVDAMAKHKNTSLMDKSGASVRQAPERSLPAEEPPSPYLVPADAMAMNVSLDKSGAALNQTLERSSSMEQPVSPYLVPADAIANYKQSSQGGNENVPQDVSNDISSPSGRAVYENTSTQGVKHVNSKLIFTYENVLPPRDVGRVPAYENTKLAKVKNTSSSVTKTEGPADGGDDMLMQSNDSYNVLHFGSSLNPCPPPEAGISASGHSPNDTDVAGSSTPMDS